MSEFIFQWAGAVYSYCTRRSEGDVFAVILCVCVMKHFSKKLERFPHSHYMYTTAPLKNQIQIHYPENKVIVYYNGQRKYINLSVYYTEHVYFIVVCTLIIIKCIYNIYMCGFIGLQNSFK